MDSYLNDKAPVLVPLHPNQQAQQSGKPVETTFHRLVIRFEKVFDRQETALGVPIGIEGAFNNTCYDNMCDVLSDVGVIIALCGGLGPPCRVQSLREDFHKRLREYYDKIS